MCNPHNNDDLKWITLGGAAVVVAFFAFVCVIAHGHHEEAMAHIAAGHVQDTHGNWVLKP